jgi:hypothetical protein
MSENKHGLNIHLKCTARDAEGNVIGTSEKDYDTALDQLANALIVGVLGGAAGTYKANDITDTSTAISLPFALMEVDAGTDLSGSYPNTDYVLAAPILVASGVMGSQVIAAGAPAFGGTFTITGTFTNATAGPLVYGEVGIMATDDASAKFLLTHDATNSTFGYTVPIAGTLDVVYTVNYT